jgi:hypothetical protein
MEFLRRHLTEKDITPDIVTFATADEGISVYYVKGVRILCVKHNGSGIFEPIQESAREASVIMEANKLYVEMKKHTEDNPLPLSACKMIENLRTKFLAPKRS